MFHSTRVNIECTACSLSGQNVFIGPRSRALRQNWRQSVFDHLFPTEEEAPPPKKATPAKATPVKPAAKAEESEDSDDDDDSGTHTIVRLISIFM